MSQLLGLKALSLKPKYVESMRKEYDRRRKVLVHGLNNMGLGTRMPQGAFYAFANIKSTKMKSLTFSQKLLKESKVAVVPGTEFGSAGEGYVRLSYASPYTKIIQALQRVESFLNKH
jgi:aminotransferase